MHVSSTVTEPTPLTFPVRSTPVPFTLSPCVAEAVATRIPRNVSTRSVELYSRYSARMLLLSLVTAAASSIDAVLSEVWEQSVVGGYHWKYSPNSASA